MGWVGGGAVDAGKARSDTGRGEQVGRELALPGESMVGSDRAGQPELGVHGQDQQGPSVCCGWVAQHRSGPAQGLFDHAEGVLEVEAA